MTVEWLVKGLIVWFCVSFLLGPAVGAWLRSRQPPDDTPEPEDER